MKILPYLLSAAISCGAYASEIPSAPITFRGDERIRPVYEGVWEDAVRFMYMRTKKTGVEHAFVYVFDSQKLFDIGENSKGDEVNYSVDRLKQAVASSKGKKRHIHTHPNFLHKKTVLALQKLVDDAKYQMVHDMKPFCHIDYGNILASAIRCDSLPEYYRDEKGRVSQPHKDLEDLMAKTSMLRKFKQDGRLAAFALPSANDLYMSLLVKLEDPGNIDLALVEVADGERIFVTSYDAEQGSNFQAYSNELRNRLLDCHSFDEKTVQELAGIANRNGLRISFSHVKK